MDVGVGHSPGKAGGADDLRGAFEGTSLRHREPIPGQEERNSDHLLEEGVAIRCNNLPVLAYKVDRLLDDHTRFASMQSNSRRLGRPGAAGEIARNLLKLYQAS